MTLTLILTLEATFDYTAYDGHVKRVISSDCLAALQGVMQTVEVWRRARVKVNAPESYADSYVGLSRGAPVYYDCRLGLGLGLGLGFITKGPGLL